MYWLLVGAVLILTGCASINEDGKKSLGWVISDKGGCIEKIGFRKKGLVYKKCF